MNLLKVNDEVINEASIVIRLKYEGKFKEALMQEIKLRVLKQAAKERNFEVSEAELQEYADQKRQELGLYSVADTKKYLANLGISMDQWADELENELLLLNVKKKLFPPEEVDNYFAENKFRFQSLRIGKILVENEETAEEIKTQIVEEGEDFAELAEDNSLHESAPAGGCLGIVKRGELNVELENRLFSEEVLSIVGPIKEEKGYALYKIGEKIEPELTDDLREEIADGLFEVWKNNLIAGAKIEAVEQ